jgi:hypothetical protein
MSQLQLAAVLVMAFSVRDARAQQLFKGDFESAPFGGWTRLQAADLDRLKLGSSTTHTDFHAEAVEGSKAGKFTILGGDQGVARNWFANGTSTPVGDSSTAERCEVLLSSSNIPEGEERWYHWWTRWNDGEFGPVPRGTWQIFMQVHHEGGGSPPVAFDVVTDGRLHDGTTCAGECIVLDLLDYSALEPNGDFKVKRFRIAPLTRNTWHRFLVRVRWSSNDTLGRVEVWHNSASAPNPAMPPTLAVTNRTLRANPHHLKQGLYRRDGASDATVYHDAMTVWKGGEAPREELFLIQSTTPDGRKVMVPVFL